MATKESIRKTAERRRRYMTDLSEWSVDYEKTYADEDCMDLADAYLAEYRTDDGEAWDEDWFRAVGFSIHEGDYIKWAEILSWHKQYALCVEVRRNNVITVNGTPVPGLFRGDVRRLCKALGIGLKETP